MKKQKVWITIFLMFSLTVFIPFVNGVYVSPFSVPATDNISQDTGYYIGAVYPNNPTDATRSALGTAFIANTTTYLDSVTMWLFSEGQPNALIGIALMSISTGTVGIDAVPSSGIGGILAFSSLFNTTVLIPSNPLEVVFEFDGTYQLQQGFSYILVLYGETDVSLSTLHNAIPQIVTDTQTSNTCSYYSGSWHASNATNKRMSILVNGYNIDPTPTPTLSPTVAPTTPPPPTTFDTYLNWLLWGIIIAGFITFLCIVVYAKNKRDTQY